MNRPAPGTPANPHPLSDPTEIRVLRVLGKGRAARAQLVDATFPSGKVVRCVEKVFAPGLLTRTLYRLSFQSPFAYQSNRDAILSCFYRRRVAAAVLAASDLDVDVAAPLYVRYDRSQRAWVLAAQWIEGRGIRPAEARPDRIRRWLVPEETARETLPPVVEEISQLVALMSQVEHLFGRCGLVGSGWQVSPRAMVSTANLLRVGDRYTIIDLESGIPAVLVPRYLVQGFCSAQLPPFDDLDASKIDAWLQQHERLLTFRLGPAGVATLQNDVRLLVRHTQRWKSSEIALLRRPWRWFRQRERKLYRNECWRRWQQNEYVDAENPANTPPHRFTTIALWCAGLLPSSFGRTASRLIGRPEFRTRAWTLLCNRHERRQWFARRRQRAVQAWTACERLPPHTATLTFWAFAIHLVLSLCTPASLHRVLSDSGTRRRVMSRFLLLLASRRYQSWFGQRQVEGAIDKWQREQRIDSHQADALRNSLSGNEIRAYVRGFGMHLALKAFAPLLVPAKVGGVAAFVASGEVLFLIPLLITPALRTAVTLGSAWATRREGIPHGEAFLVGLMPVIGSLAFPFQTFALRPDLSVFLIREAASKLGRRVPIYGGADSRTEIAMIGATDWIIELLQLTNSATQQVFQTASCSPMLAVHPTARTRLGQWVDHHAQALIRWESEAPAQGEEPARRIAA